MQDVCLRGVDEVDGRDIDGLSVGVDGHVDSDTSSPEGIHLEKGRDDVLADTIEDKHLPHAGRWLVAVEVQHPLDCI